MSCRDALTVADVLIDTAVGAYEDGNHSLGDALIDSAYDFIDMC
jgi:hypothetical protein